MVIYAVGDIHGEAGLLLEMLAVIRDDFAVHGEGLVPAVIFMGDYVDRGADSHGVVDCLRGDPLPGFRRHCLLGNHEAAMLDFMSDPVDASGWLDFGGLATLRSYGISPTFGGMSEERLHILRDALAEALPPDHFAFLHGLELCVVYGDYAFVHAGIRPGHPLANQQPDDLLWIRSPFLDATRAHEKTIVHGHTIVPNVDIRPNRIAIDTGAYQSGRLSAIALQGETVRPLEVCRPRAAAARSPALAIAS
jgi:serine/threonine protein phosphatase 1